MFHWRIIFNIEIFIFANFFVKKTRLWAITVSEGGRGNLIFFLFVLDLLQGLMESCFKIFIIANFVQKIDFAGSKFQEVGVTLAEFHLFELSPLRLFIINGNLFWSSKKLRWTNIFTFEIFIFPIFVQKIDFE